MNAAPRLDPDGLKTQVARFWNRAPCGSGHGGDAAQGSPEFFARTETARYRLEPFIGRFAQFDRRRQGRMLEVGCGMGVDHANFARHGAHAFAVDLTENGCRLTSQRVAHAGHTPRVSNADCERLPFPDDCFDFVYSWGVIHHSPDTPRAARELVRVLKPGGRLVAMIYNRHSLVALQAYMVYGLLRGRPRRGLAEIIAAHLESPGTKAYTLPEARALLPALQDLRVTPVVTPYDLRVGRSRYLPRPFARLVPRRLGYFLVLEGRKL